MRVSSLLFAVWLAVPASAETPSEKLNKLLAELPRQGLWRSALGVTRHQTPIPFVATTDDLDPATKKVRILLVGGVGETEKSVPATVDCLKWFHTAADAAKLRERFSVSAVPCLNIDGRNVDLVRSGFPPKGEAYSDPINPEAVYLWRWLGVFAPDLVVVVRRTEVINESDGLVTVLAKTAPAGVGKILARDLQLLQGVPHMGFASMIEWDKLTPSPARQEMSNRIARPPLEVAKQLAKHYGQGLPSVEYISALALVGRLQLGELTKDKQHSADVERILTPYLSGAKAPGTDKAGPAALAGHLVFAELAQVKNDPMLGQATLRAADRCLGERGVPGHSDMSDAVFMGCPLLARAGKLSSEQKYFTACVRNLALMQKLCLRKDGLYRHSPLDETAWGRGNGFPALGLALSLSDLPRDFPGRETVLKEFRAHLTALLKHQSADGCWHQVIDFPGSYRELSCTCMITFALARGVREGWLDRATFEPAMRKGWQAIKTRVGRDGSLIDVCTGTGKQKSLRDYLDRKAILGPDPRGGAMALLVAVEMARAE